MRGHYAANDEQEEVIMAEIQEKKQAVTIPDVIGVGEFAEKLGLPVTKVIGELMRNGVMATINEQIDFDTAVC